MADLSDFRCWLRRLRYPAVWDRVSRDVFPVRAANNRKVYRDYWWQFAEKRPALTQAITNDALDRV
jgi:hypothetical protein